MIELLISLLLSSFVLIALMSIFSSLLRRHVDIQMRGEVSSWTLIALDQVNQEIENASYLQNPPAGNPMDVLSGCVNYSVLWGGRLQNDLLTDPEHNVTAFYYCRAADIDPGAAVVPALLRYEKVGTGLVCPNDIPAPATCGAAASGATMSVIARHLNKRYDDGPTPKPIFTRRDDGVEMRFNVGRTTATPNTAGVASHAIPVFIKVGTFLRTNKALAVDN